MRQSFTILPAFILILFFQQCVAVSLPLFASGNTKRCPASAFKCADGRCILKKWRCDEQLDCRDGSDETDCPPRSCSPHQHLCDGRKCIPVEWLCDKRKDCDDGSDETPESCEKAGPETFWRCPTSKVCIPSHWRCDGDRDCPGTAEDEDKKMCSATHKCREDELPCANRQECVPKKVWCDGVVHCKDNSDENNSECPKKSTTTTESPEICIEREFKCSSGRCIPGMWVCDGFDDCDDGEDERTCNRLSAASIKN